MRIDLESSHAEILLNPRLPEKEQKVVRKQLNAFQHLDNHLWIATSGTSGVAKWAALAKTALLASAHAVNSHLDSSAKDCWIHALPDFHVAGVGIWARAHLSGASVIDFKEKHEKWEATAFHRMARDTGATLSALVPTQVHDLVLLKLRAPPSLRAVVVGGGALEASLYAQAISLGWPLLPSYGMTECASQVATASLESICCEDSIFPSLIPLKHLQVAISDEGTLKIRGSSLLTGYAIASGKNWEFVDPKISGWLYTQDRGELDSSGLRILGRADRVIKVGGENVDMDQLEGLLDEIKLQLKISFDCVLHAFPDDRLGYVVGLVTTDAKASQPVVDQFQVRVLPIARIRQVRELSEIPRTPLGKVRRPLFFSQLRH